MDRAGGAPGRIAYVVSTTSGTGGAERLLVKLVEAGDARGWEQLVLNPFARELPAAFEGLAQSPRYRRRPCDRATDLLAVRGWVQRELDRFRPDITHVMLFHATLVVASVRRRASGPRLLTHVYGEALRSQDKAAVKTRLDCLAGRRFDHVVAISDAVHRFLVEHCGQPRQRLTTIPPGWEGEPLPRDESPRRPTMVCVAGLRPEKRHELLIAALPDVVRRVPNAQLVLVGDGEMRTHLEALVAAEHLQDHVEFAGAVPEVWSRLAAADVFVLTSVSEAFGMAIVEAMAAGLPVVAPDVGGIPELVVPGTSGLLFPVGDHVQLADHLVELLVSPDTRARMGEAARRAAEPLRMVNTLPMYFELYGQLLDQERRRATGRG